MNEGLRGQKRRWRNVDKGKRGCQVHKETEKRRWSGHVGKEEM